MKTASCRSKSRVAPRQQPFALFLGLLALLLVPALVASAQQTFFDPTNFVVLGEGLAAGMADFGLRSVYQEKSFPAQMASQMDVAFPQPLMQGAGVGSVPGFPKLPLRLPGPDQGAVRKDFPPQLFVFNLSVPGFRARDALSRRPTPPLVQRNDELQTLTNLVLGYPSLILKDKPLWTQLEYAQFMRPSLIVVELGYYDVLEAAALGDPSRMTPVAEFRTTYQTILQTLRDRTDATIIALTVPDPLDTAYFTPLGSASANVRAGASDLQALYNFRADDLLTPNGLTAIALQFDANNVGSLPPGSVISGDVASQVRTRVGELNQAIRSLAQENGALVYDLHALFARVRDAGLAAGERVLTRDYMGGFYSMNGYYPAATGHALIANELLTLLNQTYDAGFPLIDLAEVAAGDPAVRSIPLKKPSSEELQ